MRKIPNKALGRPDAETFKTLPKMPVVVVLDNVRSHYNVGSVFRNCDVFAAESLWLGGITAKPPHRDIHKTALGATQSVSWQYGDQTGEIVRQLKKAGYKVYAVEQVEGAISLADMAMAEGEKYALIFGHEVFGVNEKILPLVDGAIVIPQSGTKHSLNIAVSTGVVLWAFYQQWLAQ